MIVFKIIGMRKFLVLAIVGFLFVGFMMSPLEITVSAAASISRMWRSAALPAGGFEGGWVIGDINKTNRGEEVLYAGKGAVVALDGRTGRRLWTHTDSAVGGYAKPNMYDIDNDGNLEILVPLYYPPGLLVLRSDGSLMWRQTFGSSGTVMSSPVAADVDGNGKLEIFLGMQDVQAGGDNRFSGQIRKFSYSGTVLAQSFIWRACGGGVSIADTDHDGQFEIYVGDRDMYMGDGGYGKGVRSFWASNLTQRWYYPDVLCSSQVPVIADANGDGMLDIIVSNMRGGLAVLNATSGAPLKIQSSIALPGAPNPDGVSYTGLPGHQQLTVYDIDGDGHQEVLTADGAHPSSRWPDNEIVIFDLKTWTVDARIVTGNHNTPDTGQFGPTLADVDGDGKMEIITYDDFGMQVFKYTSQKNQYGLQVYKNIYTDAPSGTFPNGGSASGVIYGRYAIVQDIDGDGNLEIVAVSSGPTVYAFAWKTTVPKPAQRIRSEVVWYSEYRRGAAEHIVIDIIPPAKTMVQSSDQVETIDAPTAAGLSIAETQDAWYAEAVSQQKIPLLVSSDGTNSTNADLVCSTPDGSGATFNWYDNGVSLTNVLFTFDSNNPSVVKDYSPYGNNGIVHGATPTTGILGGAYYFDGVSDYITVSDGGAGYFNGTSSKGTLGGDGTWPEITVELWVYLSGSQSSVRFAAKMPSYEMGLDSNGMLFAGVWTQNGTDYTELGFITYVSTTSNTTILRNTWNHVAFTYNNAGLTLYLNGNPVGFTSRPTGNIHCSSGEPLYLGWFNPFHGNMDELRVYPRALSAQQIKQRYLEVKNGIINSSKIASQETLGAEEWKCNVIQGSSSTSSNALRILNNPPAVGNLKVGPHQQLLPSSSDSLVALYDYHDIDEFRTSSKIDEQRENGTEIRWYKNGVLVNQYNNMRTLPIGAASPGESWKFSVRPRDGVDFGNLVNSSSVVIVLNSAPAISGTPSLTQSGGNLKCAAISSDPNGQPVTNVYNWFVNSVSLTKITFPFDTDNVLTTGDYSPYGNNGAISGVTWTSAGVVGGAYVFDGNDSITVPDSNSVGPQTTTGWSEISIEFWIKVTTDQNGSRIIARKVPWESTGSYMIGFQTTGSPSNTLFFGVSVPGQEAYAPTYVDLYNDKLSDPLNTVLKVGNWYHVLCTYKSGLTGGLNIYINGTRRANRVLNDTAVTPVLGGGAIQSADYRNNDEPLFIGYDGWGKAGSSVYLKGVLDEIRIYGRALAPAQVQQRFIDSRNGETSSATIVSQETQTGQSWYCQVIPNDKYMNGPPKNSNNQTIP